MQTYFDRREGREKPVPDCARVGLCWDEETQRCERKRKSLWERLMNGHNSNMSPDGMGFLPGPAIAPLIGAGPVGWVVAGIATAVSVLSRLFGGRDDQATTYRPPTNSAEQFVHFEDEHGNEYVAYDLGPASIAEAARRGNRWEDIYSYYSAFLSGSTNAGASSAARRVIEDAARINNISIQRAADWILRTAGVTRIVIAPGPRQSGQAGSQPTGLPGYCVGGTYHPYPIGHPQQDLCVPFPTGTQGGSQQGQTGQTGQPTRPRITQPPRPSGVPANYWFNPQTGQWEPMPQCPAGSVFDPNYGQCRAASQSGGLFDGLDSNLWLWLLLAAAGVMMLSDGSDRPSGGRRR